MGHVIRCDGPQCGSEQNPEKVIGNPRKNMHRLEVHGDMDNTNYFCTFTCLYHFAIMNGANVPSQESEEPQKG